jgi:predicted TPR repeat methyltransferase
VKTHTLNMEGKKLKKKALDYFKDASINLEDVDTRSAIYKIKSGIIQRYAKRYAIDIGAGDGVYTEPLALNCVYVAAVDPSLEMLRHLMVRCANSSNIDVHNIDAKDIKCPSNYVNIIISYSTLYYIKELYTTIFMSHDWLQEGGILSFDVINGKSLGAIYSNARWPIQQYTVDMNEMKRFLEDVGFVIIEEHRTELIPRVNLPLIKRILDTRLGNVSVDEFISSLPLIRNFAFRTTFVVVKRI